MFDKSKLNRIGKIYDLSIEVKVTDISSSNSIQEKRIGEDGYDGEDVGLDKHLLIHTSDQEIAELDNKKAIELYSMLSVKMHKHYFSRLQNA